MQHRGVISCSKENLTLSNKFDNILTEDRISKIRKHCQEDIRYDFLDADQIIPNQSMHINMSVVNQSFLDIVTETCFYDRFNHLTEKIFKPIIMLQPFVLCSTPHSLSYLKRYGFKTFDKWIDESYDGISNPEKRIMAITDQIQKFASMSKSQLHDIYDEMLPTLEYNRSHFFNNLYDIVNKEMWDNFNIVYNKK